MTAKFISEKIEVELNKETRLPILFIWKNKEYRVSKIKSSWQDYGFGSSPAPKRVPWRMRHHRIYYQIETIDGKLYEIYFDRGTKINQWILVQEI